MTVDFVRGEQVGKRRLHRTGNDLDGGAGLEQVAVKLGARRKAAGGGKPTVDDFRRLLGPVDANQRFPLEPLGSRRAGRAGIGGGKAVAGLLGGAGVAQRGFGIGHHCRLGRRHRRVEPGRGPIGGRRRSGCRSRRPCPSLGEKRSFECQRRRRHQQQGKGPEPETHPKFPHRPASARERFPGCRSCRP